MVHAYRPRVGHVEIRGSGVQGSLTLQRSQGMPGLHMTLSQKKKKEKKKGKRKRFKVKINEVRKLLHKSTDHITVTETEISILTDLLRRPCYTLSALKYTSRYAESSL